jgi:hypothetical protein
MAGGLEALEFVKGLVEAPFYTRFVAGELGEGVYLFGIPLEGAAERSGIRMLFSLHLLSSRESLLVLLFVGYICGACGEQFV